jgi:SH3-like domain-containing protein
MTRRLLAVAILAAVVPQLALARPAIVRVFEAAARAEPSREAAVLQVFAERAEVSVSEESQGGWRRVRLQDGGVGWLEESAIAFPETIAATPIPAAAPATLAPHARAAAPIPDLRARIYVKNLSHLSELVSSDATVAPKAESLANRRRASIATWIVGGLASVALLGASAATDMPDPGDPRWDAEFDKRMRLTGAGIGVGVTSALLGLAIHPRRSELLDVVNAWNVRHPDEQFEIRGGEVGR